MKDNRVFCIGDVHGCFYTMKALVDKIPKDSRIIFLGDLNDKGNHTKKVFDFVIENNFEVIKGNHEILMERYLSSFVTGSLKSNIWSKSKRFGGMKTIQNYQNIEDVNKHVEFIRKMPLYLELDNYFLTHGFGLPYFKNRKKANEKMLCSNRIDCPYPNWEDYSKYEMINIFGHCDFMEVEKGKNYFGIDTSCVYGNKLTAFELYTHNIIQEKVHFEDICED